MNFQVVFVKVQQGSAVIGKDRQLEWIVVYRRVRKGKSGKTTKPTLRKGKSGKQSTGRKRRSKKLRRSRGKQGKKLRR